MPKWEKSVSHTNYKDFFVDRIDKKSATSWVTHIHSKKILLHHIYEGVTVLSNNAYCAS